MSDNDKLTFKGVKARLKEIRSRLDDLVGVHGDAETMSDLLDSCSVILNQRKKPYFKKHPESLKLLSSILDDVERLMLKN